MPRTFAFIHGGGQGSWVWQDTIAAMQELAPPGQLHCVALDVPGCGSKRDRDTASISLDDVAVELIADIEKQAKRDVIAIAHSQGGQALSLMAQKKPQLFGQLVYLSCSIPQAGQTTLQLMGNSRHGENANEVGWPLDPASTAIEARYEAMFCNDMNPDQARTFLSRLGKDMWPAQSYSHTQWPGKKDNTVPATYILCLRDQSLPTEWQRQFADRFNAKKLIEIDAGHQAMNTQPRVLAQLLLDL